MADVIETVNIYGEKIKGRIIKENINTVIVAAIGVWQGLESGDFYRVMLNSLIGCYWLVQI